MQLTLAPHLTVTGTGDQTVDLSWTKPQTPSGSTITGYELRYRKVGTSNWMTDTVSGPDTLARQVTGLTNGTEYEFEVRATYDHPVVKDPGATPSRAHRSAPSARRW